VAVTLHPSVFEKRDRWITAPGPEHSRVIELCLRTAIISASFEGRRILTADMIAPEVCPFMSDGPVQRRKRLGGLLNYYYRARLIPFTAHDRRKGDIRVFGHYAIKCRLEGYTEI
jgi:hypothetical protein